jgi:hypothetical protein
MSSSKASGPTVPTQNPDRDIVERSPEEGGQDRPGFDLGGATQQSDMGAMPSPKGRAAGRPSPTGRATGHADPSGSRSLGNEGDTGSAVSGPGVGGARD